MSGLYDKIRGLDYKPNDHRKKKLITVFLFLIELRFYESISLERRYSLWISLSKIIINIFQTKVFFPMFHSRFNIFSGVET